MGEKLLRRDKRRIWEIDFLRGICIVLMIFDHMMFDFYAQPGFMSNFYTHENVFFHQMADLAHEYWWYWLPRQIVRYSVIFLFLFLSGISCSLTRSNANRLRKLSIGAALVTIVTVGIDLILSTKITIAFGILHIFALNVLIFMILKAVFPNRYFYLIIGLVITIMGFFLPVGNGETAPFWEIGTIDTYVRDSLHELNWDTFGKVLAGTHLYGSDSYGVFPYTGFFLLGAGTGATIYTKKRSLIPGLNGRWNQVYSFIGRNGLKVYVIHQVAVFAIVTLCALAVGFRF